MSKPEYPSCIRELYESEIFGETFALALVEAARNDRDRYHFGTLLQLETETKARLRPFLCKYHFHKAEPSLSARITVGYHVCRFDTAVLGKQLMQILVGC